MNRRLLLQIACLLGSAAAGGGLFVTMPAVLATRPSPSTVLPAPATDNPPATISAASLANPEPSSDGAIDQALASLAGTLSRLQQQPLLQPPPPWLGQLGDEIAKQPATAWSARRAELTAMIGKWLTTQRDRATASRDQWTQFAALSKEFEAKRLAHQNGLKAHRAASARLSMGLLAPRPGETFPALPPPLDQTEFVWLGSKESGFWVSKDEILRDFSDGQWAPPGGFASPADAAESAQRLSEWIKKNLTDRVKPEWGCGVPSKDQWSAMLREKDKLNQIDGGAAEVLQGGLVAGISEQASTQPESKRARLNTPMSPRERESMMHVDAVYSEPPRVGGINPGSGLKRAERTLKSPAWDESPGWGYRLLIRPQSSP